MSILTIILPRAPNTLYYIYIKSGLFIFTINIIFYNDKNINIYIIKANVKGCATNSNILKSYKT